MRVDHNMAIGESGVVYLCPKTAPLSFTACGGEAAKKAAPNGKIAAPEFRARPNVTLRPRVGAVDCYLAVRVEDLLFLGLAAAPATMKVVCEPVAVPVSPGSGLSNVLGPGGLGTEARAAKARNSPRNSVPSKTIPAKKSVTAPTLNSSCMRAVFPNALRHLPVTGDVRPSGRVTVPVMLPPVGILRSKV